MKTSKLEWNLGWSIQSQGWQWRALRWIKKYLLLQQQVRCCWKYIKKELVFGRISFLGWSTCVDKRWWVQRREIHRKFYLGAVEHRIGISRERCMTWIFLWIHWNNNLWYFGLERRIHIKGVLMLNKEHIKR